MSIMKPAHFAAGALAAIAAVAWTGVSRAQDTTIVAQPSSPTVVPAAEHRVYTGPNRALLTSGLMAFGGTYIPSVIVAAESGRSADHHLYVPVAGPWLDLGTRPGCGSGSTGCDGETTNKVLLIGDGIIQGVGVVAVVMSFLVPERDEVVTATAKNTAKNDDTSVHVTPAQVGRGGYGLAAFGNF
jgi:hypothetical protein